MLDCAEEAGADFTIGRKPQAVAMATKRFRDRSNNPDLALALADGPAFGGFGFVFGSNRNERNKNTASSTGNRLRA